MSIYVTTLFLKVLKSIYRNKIDLLFFILSIKLRIFTVNLYTKRHYWE